VHPLIAADRSSSSFNFSQILSEKNFLHAFQGPKTDKLVHPEKRRRYPNDWSNLNGPEDILSSW